jgi:hypothetical protein
MSDPWNMSWDDIKKANGEAVGIEQPAPPSNVKPWEMNSNDLSKMSAPMVRKDWRTDKVVDTPPKNKARSAAEEQMAKDVVLSPAERAREITYERSDANIKELEQEIAQSSGENKKILQAELTRLNKERSSTVSGTTTLREVDERFQKDPDPAYQLSNQYNERKFNELEKSASKVPEFSTIVSFLKELNALPKLKPIYNGNRGEFTYGSGVAPEGELGIDMSHFYDTSKSGYEPSQSVVSTYIHEHTHAAVRQIRQLQDVVNNKPASERSAQEKQFLNTYSKLLPATMNNDFRSGITRIAQSINAEWVKKHSDYRASDSELPAYAVGNQFKKGKDYDTPDHVDPSIATTFMILLDQAKKVGKK